MNRDPLDAWLERAAAGARDVMADYAAVTFRGTAYPKDTESEMQKRDGHLTSPPEPTNRVPASLTDLEMTKLCAEAMGFQRIRENFVARPGIGASIPYVTVSRTGTSMDEVYEPLRDDAQAMALVLWLSERGDISIVPDRVYFTLFSGPRKDEQWIFVMRRDPERKRRAIVECVAKMRAASQA